MRVTRAAATRTCAICERTLLMGEHTMRFAPDASGYVDVCTLCQEVALEHGWLREGSPTTPTVQLEQRRRRKSWSLLGSRRSGDAPVAAEPILRRLSEAELEVVEAADLFNGSAHRRTVDEERGTREHIGEVRAPSAPREGEHVGQRRPRARLLGAPGRRARAGPVTDGPHGHSALGQQDG